MSDSNLGKKEYHRVYSKQWALDNPDKIREANNRADLKSRTTNTTAHYSKKIYRERRRTSDIKGIAFDISYEYVMSLPHMQCPILGHTLEWGTGSHFTASLDRIRPELGYVEGNIQWVCWRANTLKSDITKEESEKLHEWIKINL